MASDVDELSIAFEEDGVLIVKELAKAVLSKGAWTTIVFRYQQWDRPKKEYSPDRYTIRRYRKIEGKYVQQSKFNISNAQQAQKIIDVLQDWLK